MTVDYAILGAGIAGLSVAHALAERDCRVAVVEKNAIAAGASGTPGALVNPATGRQGKRAWRADRCIQHVQALLKTVSSFSDKPLFHQNGVLRPAADASMAVEMRQEFEKTHWAADQCQWLSKNEIVRRHPGLHCIEGGLWLPQACTVEVPAYLQALARYLQSKSVMLFEHAHATIRESVTGWTLSFDDKSINAGHLIFCTGAQTSSFSRWQHLPLQKIKGQIVEYSAPGHLLAFTHSISSAGYLARLPYKNTFVQGSTYEHEFTSRTPDVSGARYLRKQLHNMLPRLAEKAQIVNQWAGVRLMAPDHKPLIGTHPSRNQLHLFTALGSKGLLYGAYLANRFIAHLLDNRPLPKAVDMQRFDG